MANQAQLENLKRDPFKDVWDAIRRLVDDYGELRGKLDGLLERETVDQAARDSLTALTARVEVLETWRATAAATLDDHETRLNVLETVPPSHTHAYADLTGIPSTFAPATHGNSAHSPTFAETSHTHAYSSLTSIPSTFTPSAHTHAYSEIMGRHGNDAHEPTFATADHNHDSSYASSGHNHSGVYSETSHTHAYSSLTSIPSTFTPATHGNEAHSPAFATDSAFQTTKAKVDSDIEPALAFLINTTIPNMKSTYNAHTHNETGTTTSGPNGTM